MKTKTLLLLGLVITKLLEAQTSSDIIMQPGHFVSRQITNTGEVTKEYDAGFSYSQDGKLSDFNFPDFSLSSHYTYEDHLLANVLTHHYGGHPLFDESLTYQYEDGKIKSFFHGWGAMNRNECWTYTYDENGRLARKDYGTNSSDTINYFLYEYEDDDRTVTETSYVQILQGSWQVVWVPNKITTSRYSEDYQLLSVQTDKFNYNGGGEITQSVLLTYLYTPSGRLAEEITQILVEEEWANNAIMRYMYDDLGRVSEQQNGIWSKNLDDWTINQKVVFETSEDGSIYTVSFLKKVDDNWEWDLFNNQTLFFNNVSKSQQQALGYFVYEDMNGSASVNQFEFEMTPTERPFYLSPEKEEITYSIFPNPGKDNITIKAPVENSVIRFYDLQGRLLLAKPFDFNTTVNTDNWTPGLYLWEIWNGPMKEASGKWIKDGFQ